MRLKRHRPGGEQALRTPWPPWSGHAQGAVQGVGPAVVGGTAGRRFGGTNELPRTPREGNAQASHRQQSEAPCRELKQEWGWGGCAWQQPPALWVPLPVGV